jgi:hypothetical protein
VRTNAVALTAVRTPWSNPHVFMFFLALSAKLIKHLEKNTKKKKKKKQRKEKKRKGINTYS